jgi:sulfide dehydrogenase cytochrome subunit
MQGVGPDGAMLAAKPERALERWVQGARKPARMPLTNKLRNPEENVMPASILGKSLLIAGLALVASAAMGQDKPATVTGASDSMLANTCAGCHGTDGASAGPASPTIAGLSEEYFIETMKGFADGEIPATIMNRIAKGYSDAEIEQMAKYFAAKPFVQAGGQEFDAELAKTGAKLHDKYCEKCHADGGTSAEDDAGVLAGQWQPYLKWTMDDYLSGDRQPTKKMKKKIKELSEDHGDAGWEALYNFYASQQ